LAGFNHLSYFISLISIYTHTVELFPNFDPMEW